jgi:hypothetical protein
MAEQSLPAWLWELPSLQLSERASNGRSVAADTQAPAAATLCATPVSLHPPPAGRPLVPASTSEFSPRTVKCAPRNASKRSVQEKRELACRQPVDYRTPRLFGIIGFPCWVVGQDDRENPKSFPAQSLKHSLGRETSKTGQLCYPLGGEPQLAIHASGVLQGCPGRSHTN